MNFGVLKARPFETTIVFNGDNMCMICMNGFDTTSEVVLSNTGCRHIFHFRCLEKQAKLFGAYIKCPNCVREANEIPSK
jgi:hypothetical protein